MDILTRDISESIVRAQLIRGPGKNVSVNQLWEQTVRGEREKESEMEESDREEKNKEGRNREGEPKNLFYSLN